MNTDTDSNSLMKLIKTMEILIAKQVAHAIDLFVGKHLGAQKYFEHGIFIECIGMLRIHIFK